MLESKVEDDYNAIDPNYVEDSEHHAWLAFGSFWSGIKMRSLDAASGKLSETDKTTYSLASRVRPVDAPPNPPGLPGNWQAVEAPFIVHRGGYYYLFTSFDLCCRGIKSTYRTVVGRSKSITGPYVDREGRSDARKAAGRICLRRMQGGLAREANRFCCATISRT